MCDTEEKKLLIFGFMNEKYQKKIITNSNNTDNMVTGAIAKAVAPPSVVAVAKEEKPVEIPKIDFRSEDPVER